MRQRVIAAGGACPDRRVEVRGAAARTYARRLADLATNYPA